MPRTPIIVRLADNKDHLVLDGEITGCGQIVPMGLPWEEGTTRRCTTCFPEGKVESAEAASETELIDEQQEVATRKTAKKATKAG